VSTKTDAVILALTALWQGVLPDVQVVDSAQANADASPRWLFVASDGDTPTDDIEVASAQQTWMVFNKVKQEAADVTCAVVVVSGETSIATVRAQANTILSTAEDTVRSDPTLGGLVMVSSVTSLRYFQNISTAGAKVRVVFTVTYQAQLS
jgi:hypothetical protein